MGTLGSKLQKLLLFIIDLVFSLFWFPSMIIFISPFLIYKSIVTLLASCLRPDLIPLPTKDQFMAWDLVLPKKPGERFVYNVGCSVRVSGRVHLATIKTKYKEMIENARHPSGRPAYPRMEQILELFGGYAFRRKAKYINIDTKILEMDLGNKSVSTFEAEWMSQGYPEDSPSWEFVLLPIEEAEETYVLMKIHHSSADAYSLLHFLNVLLDNDVPVPAKTPDDTAWEMFLQIITCPRVSLLYSLDVLKSSFAPLPWAGYNQTHAIFQSSTSLCLSDIKRIQRKTRISYTPISLALFGGVLARIITEQERAQSKAQTSGLLGKRKDRSTFVQLSLPLPNHPLTEMCNHWTSGAIRVPLGQMKPSERLKSIDENYKLYHERRLDKLMHWILFPPGSLVPTKVFPSVYEGIRRLSCLGAVFTSVIGFQDDFYSLDGHPVISLSSLLGMLGKTPVITGLGLSYHDRYEVTMIATQQIAESQADMDKIVSIYLSEELQKLLQDTES